MPSLALRIRSSGLGSLNGFFAGDAGVTLCASDEWGATKGSRGRAVKIEKKIEGPVGCPLDFAEGSTAIANVSRPGDLVERPALKEVGSVKSGDVSSSASASSTGIGSDG